ADLHLIAKMNPHLLQLLNPARQIGHLKNHPVPSTRLLVTTVGHWARTRSPGTTENQFKIPNRDLSESRQILRIQLQPKLLGVECNRALHIFDLIAHAPKSQNKTLRFLCGALHCHTSWLAGRAIFCRRSWVVVGCRSRPLCPTRSPRVAAMTSRTNS